MSKRAFAVAWMLRENAALKNAGVSPEDLAREAQALIERFPTAAQNDDERRRLRAGLYIPLLKLPRDERTEIVDGVMDTLFRE